MAEQRAARGAPLGRVGMPPSNARRWLFGRATARAPTTGRGYAFRACGEHENVSQHAAVRSAGLRRRLAFAC
jgi:hypothetical protein